MSESARKDTPEQAEFRSYCQGWLKDNLPGEPPVRLPLTPLEIMSQEQLSYLQTWQKSAYDAGLVGCDYSVEVGGGEAADTPADNHQIVFLSEVLAGVEALVLTRQFVGYLERAGVVASQAGEDRWVVALGRLGLCG